MAGMNIRTVYPNRESVMAVLFSIAYLFSMYAMDHSLTPKPDMLIGRQVMERETTQIAAISKRGTSIPMESETI